MASQANGSPGLSRRRFGGRFLMLAGGIAAGATAPLSAAADATPFSVLAAPAQSKTGGVEAKLENVIARWGSRLSLTQRHRLRRIIGYHQTMLDHVRAISLANADAPATVLKDQG